MKGAAGKNQNPYRHQVNDTANSIVQNLCMCGIQGVQMKQRNGVRKPYHLMPHCSAARNLRHAAMSRTDIDDQWMFFMTVGVNTHLNLCNRLDLFEVIALTFAEIP